MISYFCKVYRIERAHHYACYHIWMKFKHYLLEVTLSCRKSHECPWDWIDLRPVNQIIALTLGLLMVILTKQFNIVNELSALCFCIQHTFLYLVSMVPQASMMYAVIGEPPSVSGTSHATEILPLPVVVTLKWRGGSGLSEIIYKHGSIHGYISGIWRRL